MTESCYSCRLRYISSFIDEPQKWACSCTKRDLTDRLNTIDEECPFNKDIYVIGIKHKGKYEFLRPRNEGNLYLFWPQDDDVNIDEPDEKTRDFVKFLMFFTDEKDAQDYIDKHRNKDRRNRMEQAFVVNIAGRKYEKRKGV